MKNYPTEEYKEVFDKIKELKISESSARIYTYSIYNIIKVLDLKLSDDVFDDNDVIKTLKKKDYKLSTYKNKIASIIAFLKAYKRDKDVIEKYNNELDITQSKMLREQKKFEKTETEKDNWMDKEQLENKLTDMKKNIIKLDTFEDIEDLMRYTLLMFHINYPLRNDLSDAEVYNMSEFKKIKEDPEKNYIVLGPKSGHFILNNYKTKKHHGKQKIFIDNNEVLKTLNQYYKALSKYKKENDINNNWFIIKKNGDKYTRNDYTKLFNKIFKKKISTSLLRKIIVSDTWNMDKIKALSDKMQHTPEQALKSYVKMD